MRDSQQGDRLRTRLVEHSQSVTHPEALTSLGRVPRAVGTQLTCTLLSRVVTLSRSLLLLWTHGMSSTVGRPPTRLDREDET